MMIWIGFYPLKVAQIVFDRLFWNVLRYQGNLLRGIHNFSGAWYKGQVLVMTYYSGTECGKVLFESEVIAIKPANLRPAFIALKSEYHSAKHWK